MRQQKWWLRGRKLVPRSVSLRLTPRGDDANAPPYLPLAPVVESNAVHNIGGFSVDDFGGGNFQMKRAVKQVGSWFKSLFP